MYKLRFLRIEDIKRENGLETPEMELLLFVLQKLQLCVEVGESVPLFPSFSSFSSKKCNSAFVVVECLRYHPYHHALTRKLLHALPSDLNQIGPVAVANADIIAPVERGLLFPSLAHPRDEDFLPSLLRGIREDSLVTGLKNFIPTETCLCFQRMRRHGCTKKFSP